MRPLVIYHGNCYDGFTAAWIANSALNDAELIPAKYGDPPPDVMAREVFVLDFSYPREVMQAMSAKYGKPTEGIQEYPEFPMLAEAHDDLLAALVKETGYDPHIFKRTVLMAMDNILDDEDSTPTDEQVDNIMHLSLAFAAATDKKMRAMEGKLPD